MTRINTLLQSLDSYLKDEDRRGLDGPNRSARAALERDIAQALHNLGTTPTSPNHNTPPSTRILVAYDASDQAQFALDAAVHLARQSPNPHLTLLHVFVAPRALAPEYRLADASTRDACLQTERDRLAHAKSRIPPDIPTDTYLFEGDPAAEILRAAQEFRCTLIAMGTHARGRVARALLGSTADSVLRRAPCPVLTLSHPTPTPTTVPSPAAL